MTTPEPPDAERLRGFSRLAIDATIGITDLVEALHHRISPLERPGGPSGPRRTSGVTGLVYRSVRAIARLVGGGVDATLAQLAPLLKEASDSNAQEAVVAALNGVLGDYLARTGSALAIPMRLRRGGAPVAFDALAAASPPVGGKLLVLVHGLCMNDRQWQRNGHDHGVALARDLGYTPVYLHYNTGLHIATNGRDFAAALEALLAAWPAPLTECAILAHSMGGLVARSAVHFGGIAGHRWPGKLNRMIFLGSPHQGAPLERGGHWIETVLGATQYTAPFARLARIRSAGITDLRYGNLLAEDRTVSESGGGADVQVVPLPANVRCYTIGATTGDAVGDLRDRILGDGLVPLASALGQHDDPTRTLQFPPNHQWVARAMNHMDLLESAAVYERIRRWLGEG